MITRWSHNLRRSPAQGRKPHLHSRGPLVQKMIEREEVKRRAAGLASGQGEPEHCGAIFAWVGTSRNGCMGNWKWAIRCASRRLRPRGLERWVFPRGVGNRRFPLHPQVGRIQFTTVPERDHRRCRRSALYLLSDLSEGVAGGRSMSMPTITRSERSRKTRPTSRWPEVWDQASRCPSSQA